MSSTNDFLSVPVDSSSSESLEGQNLSLGLVDTAGDAAFDTWLQAEARGFHGPSMTPEILAEQRGGLAYRRTTGVWDASSATPDVPVGTVSSWPIPLTVPGYESVDGWAISAVTVAPTHRRRGIARALLEAELRTAKSLGVPLAMLTVSEATIYSRYGFSPAALMADWSVDVTKTTWTGPDAPGRVQFLSLEQIRELGPKLKERVRLDIPGEIVHWDHLWERQIGATDDTKEAGKAKRFIRYDDADGVAQGFAIYRIVENPVDWAKGTLELSYLVAATEEAYAALWRFLFEMDLVGTVTAHLRSVDEPFRWQISDFRAARKTMERDHLWVRILDVKAALEARSYASPERMVLDISDPLGFAAGRFLVEIDDEGAASVSTLSDTEFDAEIADETAAVSLSVNDLGAMYLGGVSAVTLVRAGRVTELTGAAAGIIDGAFLNEVAPWLSVWF